MFAMEIENLKGVDNAVIDEELLTHHVQQFSVLYDKSHKDFHRKDIKRAMFVDQWNSMFWICFENQKIP